jgi:hypothetical protein
MLDLCPLEALAGGLQTAVQFLAHDQGSSTVSRAVQRVDNDPELMRDATTIIEQLQRNAMHC